jgi:ABC-2 type transport system permease protein
VRKIWLVFKREYLTRVRTKAFIISTLAVPLFMVLFLGVPVMLATRQTRHAMKIVILDEAGGMAPLVAGSLDRKLPSGKPAYQIVQTLENLSSKKESEARAQLWAEVNQDKLDGFLIIPKGVLDGAGAAFHTRNPGNVDLSEALRQALDDAVIARRLKERGIQVGDVQALVRAVPLTLVKVTKEGEVEEKGQTFAVAIVMMFLLYMTILIYGVQTMQSVQEEKSTRVVEILVSSIRPFHLLTGKLTGVGGVSLTQILIWATLGSLVGAYGASVVATLDPTSSIPHIQIPWAVLAYFVIYYLLGYFLYASLYAAVGAMVSSNEEAQHLATPINLLLAFTPIMLVFIIQRPNSTASILLSLVPFFAPVLMVLRIGLQTPPFWQIALSLLLMILTTAGLTYLSAKIYRVGILMYGKRPSGAELRRWLRYT